MQQALQPPAAPAFTPTPVNAFDLGTAPLLPTPGQHPVIGRPPVVAPQKASVPFTDAPRYPVGPVVPPKTAKPAIDQRTADWNVHVAGLNAQEQAKGMGAAPEAAAALLDASLGQPLEVEGIRLTMMNANTALLFEFIEIFSETVFPLKGAIVSNRAMAFCVAKPAEAWELIRSGNGPAFLDAVMMFTRHLSIKGANKIAQWITAEMKRLTADAEDVGLGKPPMGEGWMPPDVLLPAPAPMTFPTSEPVAAAPAGLSAL